MIISRTAIRRPVTVAMAFIGFGILGAFAGSRMQVEQYPAQERPHVGLGINYPSSTSQDVERNVARPVEEILSTIGGIDRMYSHSRPGRVWVSINLNDGEDVTAKGIEAKELIESIRHRLPGDIRHIQLSQQDENARPILTFVIAAPNLDQQDAWRLLDARVRMVLERVPGVNTVQLFGAQQQYVRIALDPGRLEAHGRDVLDVQRRLRDENFYLSAGSIDQARQETQIRPLGRFESLQDILDLPIGNGLALADIAKVSYTPRDEAEQRRLNGQSALGVSVFKKPEANLVAVANAVQETMSEAAQDPELAGSKFLTVSNQADEVIDALTNLLKNGLIGGFLSTLVLLLFIRRLFPSLLISATVPLSLVATLGVMYFAGYTLNILSVVGLMLAVGILVDNAVVVTESIALKRRDQGLSPYQAADRGVTEVGTAITAGTLTTIVVFLPSLFMSNLQVADVMDNVALPLCTSIAASLLIATTLIPALLARLPEGKKEPRYRGFERLADGYEHAINFTLHHRWSAVMVAALLAATGWYGYKQLDVNMSPADDAQSIQMRIWVRGTIALDKMEGIIDDVEGVLLEKRQEFGIGDISTSFDSDRANFLMTMLEDGKYATETLQNMILELMPELPNVHFRFEGNKRGPGRWRYGGDDDGLNVRLIGDSTEQLMVIAEDVIATLERMPILTNVHNQAESSRQELVLVVKPEQAGRLDITAQNIAQSVSVALGGSQLNRGLDQGGWEDEIHLELEGREDIRIEDLRRLPIFLPGGGTVALETLADMEFRPTLGSIRRENRETTVGVGFSLNDIAPMAARQQVEWVMRSFELPPGYRWEMGKDFDNEEEQFQEMLVVIGVAILLVYMLMAALFESILFPSVVLFAIVYSVVGVMLFLWGTNTPLTMMAMTGTVLLAGIVVNNGIVLLNRIFQLQRDGMARNAAIVQGGRDRLRPIIMTAATTVAGLTPLAIGDVRVGGSGESYMPMARAIIGGLSFATVVTLLVVPLFYVHFDNLKRGAVGFWRNATATSA